MIRVAVGCLPLERPATFDAWADLTTRRVAEAGGADLIVFPEYGAMELAGLDPAGGSDLTRAVEGVSAHLPAAWDHLAGLARAHGAYILAPSGPFGARGAAVNRAVLIAPEGRRAAQDKRVPTPWERDPWCLGPGGGPLAVVDTDLGRLGVLICYDAEFPAHARALVEAGARLILVPACTEGPRGRERVRIAARARALEGQCVVALAMTTGGGWCEPVGESTGLAGLYGPPDRGFPEDGVIAEGAVDAPGWVVADVDLAALDAVRGAGEVAGLAHWPEAHGAAVTAADLRAG